MNLTSQLNCLFCLVRRSVLRMEIIFLFSALKKLGDGHIIRFFSSIIVKKHSNIQKLKADFPDCEKVISVELILRTLKHSKVRLLFVNLTCNHLYEICKYIS